MKTGSLCAAIVAGALLGAVSIKAEEAPREAPKKEEPKKEEPKKADVPQDAAAKDPKDLTLDELEAAGICPVTKKPSKPIYHVAIGEKEYHFATRDAAKEFKAHPEKYGVKAEAKK